MILEIRRKKKKGCRTERECACVNCLSPVFFSVSVVEFSVACVDCLSLLGFFPKLQILRLGFLLENSCLGHCIAVYPFLLLILPLLGLIST